MAYIDLDGFKGINDTFGHNSGDDLLVALAQHMKAALREGDTLARMGGDEFVAVLVDLEQPSDCEPVLARLLKAASAPVAIGAQTLSVSASIGVTLYPEDGVDGDLLLRHADQAMYQAKQAGKNRYHLFDLARDAAVKHQHASLDDLRRGFRAGELLLYYQPKVNMRSGEVLGCEALLRWQHPERGLLLPGSFLPLIEDHPLSVQIGEWVLEQALTQIGRWQQQGLRLSVSVNIGAHQLQQADFVRRLEEVLQAHPDVAPQLLELEILETSALKDVAQVSQLMQACLRLGTSFSLDDFGTGYSSLTYLKRFPAEMLKIDQSFVRDMLDDPDDLAIVEAVIGLASTFGRHVIAEGVESIAHGQLLLPLGCELAQGFGIARPMPAEDMAHWIENWHTDPSWAAWRQRPATGDDLVAVYAEVSHRQWLHAMEALLRGTSETMPALQEKACGFGHWLDTVGRERFATLAPFAELVAVHHRLHDLAAEAVHLHLHGQNATALARLPTLHTLSAELIALLHQLTRMHSENSSFDS